MRKWPEIQTISRFALGVFTLAVGASSLTMACTGMIGGADGDPTKKGSSALCDPTLRPPAAELRRLTASQYRNTLRDLVAWSTKDPNAANSILAISGALANLPPDQREPTPQDVHGTYRRLDQTLQDTQVQAYYFAALDISASLTSPTWIGKVVGTCATDGNASNDAKCIDDFVRSFGMRALRRPLTDIEVASYRAVYGGSTAQDPAAYADVIGVFLNAPEFLYQVEHGDQKIDDHTYALGAWELASRLSYQLWDTMPDDALFDAARDGSLLKEDGYRKQVDRMFADPRTRQTMDGFFVDWLKAEDLADLTVRNNDPVFKSFAGANLPSAKLRAEMIQDAVDTVDWFVWNDPKGMKELLTTDVSVNRGPELAKIYGVPAWNGQGDPPRFTDGQRPGLFTRALFLTSGGANTRPILKGVFLRKHILCDELGMPPANANAVPPELRPDMTTREVVEELTQKDGTVCASCHRPMINPLGFATEGFDALGRFRTEQRLFDPMNGVLLGSKPVHTDSIPQVEFGDTKPSAGPRDLMSQIADSPKAGACFARNYFRFTYGRWEEKGDGCAIESIGEALEKGSIADMLKAAVLDKRFQQRVFD